MTHRHPHKHTSLHIFILIVFWLISASAPGLSKDVTITVNSGATHTFRYWGGNLVNQGRAQQYVNTVSESVRDSIAKMIWHDLDFRLLRICPYIGGDFQVSPNSFGTAMKPLIDDARKWQDSLIFAMTPLNCGLFDSTNIQPWIDTVVQFIRELKDSHDIPIHITAVENEPSSSGVHHNFLPGMIKEMRRELDRRGLHDVGIVGPQQPTVQPRLWNHAPIFADPDAVASLHAWAFHSYAMSLTKEAVDTVRKYGIQEIYQLEAGTSDKETEPANDSTWTARAAGLFLGDVNLGSNVWTWFLPYAQIDNWSTDSTRRVGAGIRFIGVAVDGSSEMIVYPKYFYFKQLARAFRAGTEMRLCTSDLGTANYQKYMEGTYGARPHVHAAAGIGADGRWVVGVINMSGVPAHYWTDGQGVVYTTRWWPDEEVITVTFHVEELAHVSSLDFTLERSNGTVKNEDGGTVTMNNGTVTVAVRSCELVTLIAAEAIGVAQGVRGTMQNNAGVRVVPVSRNGHTAYRIHCTGDAGGFSTVEIWNIHGKRVEKISVAKTSAIVWHAAGVIQTRWLRHAHVVERVSA